MYLVVSRMKNVVVVREAEDLFLECAVERMSVAFTSSATELHFVYRHWALYRWILVLGV